MKVIKDFEDYSIDEFGNVYSFKTNKFLKPGKDKDGYLMFRFWKNGKGYNKKVHRLVAETFIPKSNEDIELGRDCIDHIDGNRQNNHISNLRWCTVKENSNFTLAFENKKKISKHRMKAVIIDGIEYESIKEATRQLNMYKSTIQRRLKNPNFPNYNYKYDKKTIMAVDLSTKKVGIAIFYGENYVKRYLIEEKDKKILQRIHSITKKLTDIYINNNCNTLVIENVPLQMNTNVASKLLWVLGSVLANIVGAELCDDYSLLMPSEWRSILGIPNGRGIKRTEAKQLSKDYVKRTLGKNIESDDICDAICIGLAYIKQNVKEMI